MTETFTRLKGDHVLSSLGYEVQMFGRVGGHYRDADHDISLDSEGLAINGFGLVVASLAKTEAERKVILENIRRALAFMNYELHEW